MLGWVARLRFLLFFGAHLCPGQPRGQNFFGDHFLNMPSISISIVHLSERYKWVIATLEP